MVAQGCRAVELLSNQTILYVFGESALHVLPTQDYNTQDNQDSSTLPDA